MGEKSVKDFALNDLRGNIGFVSQDPFLFDSSVKENLLLASEKATELEMWNMPFVLLMLGIL